LIDNTSDFIGGFHHQILWSLVIVNSLHWKLTSHLRAEWLPVFTNFRLC